MEKFKVIALINSFLVKIQTESIQSRIVSRGNFIISTILSLAKVQINLSDSLDDDMVRALKTIASRESHYYYYHDHHELYSEFQNIYNLLSTSKLNTRFFDADLTIIKMENKNWEQIIFKIYKSIFHTFDSPEMP